MSEPIKRRFHRKRAVRRHASGKWICTIGRVWSAKKNKLVDKDWYFEGNEAQATADANAKARQWEILCLHWVKRDQPALEILGDPQPDQPRWPTNGVSPQSKLTEEQLQRIRREGVVDTAELAEAYAEFSYPELISAYEWDRRKDVSQGEVELSTLAKELSQMRQVALVLPSEIPGVQLRSEHFRSAKTKLLDQFERRTARNYLSAGVKLLRWLYGRYGGDETRIPAGIEEAITIRRATKTAIKVYGVEQLKVLIQKTKGSITQMDLMLSLNSGMYPEDIGRLTLGEVDLVEGSVFWDREKEPANPFRIHHLLWPETLRLVKKYLNDNRQPNSVFRDHRIRDGKPSQVNTCELAFLDKGRPRYLVKPSGSAYDRVGRRWSALDTGAEFRNIRKSTNEIMTTLIEHQEKAEERASMVDAIQKRFLGQKSDELILLYRTIGKGAYRQMNFFLAKVGDHLRASGVFEHIDV